MGNTKFRLGLTIAILVGLAVSFQQCSEVSFETNSADLGSQGDPQDPSDPTGPGPLEKVEEQFSVAIEDPYNKVDILFVVDESVTMTPFLAAINAGFASLRSSEFLLDTRMAVTNMAPARLDEAGNVIFQTPYAGSDTGSTLNEKISLSPGYLRLVSGTSISGFSTLFPSFGSRFVKIGCGEWFHPKEVNSQSESCLEAATQIAGMAVGVEAGLVSFSQLIQKHTQSQVRLFRESSSAHVVFVSDTHDPGATNYYGRPGAPAEIPRYQDVVDRVYRNSDRLMSLKFHGIVPLPPVGHPELQGLDVIGEIPATAEEAAGSSGEIQAVTETYSYLPFVRTSGGSAIHFKNTVWSGILRNLVSRLPVRTEPTVHLKKAATRIISVTLNGRVLRSDEYELRSDRLSLVVKVTVSDALSAQVVVNYQ